ncbi:SdrD B-like domain-containing protein [Microbacterium halotolerans]|uniref:DUF7927 domain-containing protein n=1 Tax=Microbacterium halotolerans TaxID=246613 RepID=UPI0013C2F96C|nr:SdrD B-like domain-containing protein [Microbacterium halotolerans]
MPKTVSKNPRRLAGSAAVVSTLVLLMSMLGVSAPASAATDDGTLTVSVSRTFTETGAADPTQDVPQQGMDVVVTDPAGNSVSGTTGADGLFVLAPDASLEDGIYRVEVTIPAAYDYLEPAFASLGGDYGSHVGFVDVSGGTDVTYRTAVWNPSDYVQPEPDLALPFQANRNTTTSTDSLIEWSADSLDNRDRTPTKTTLNTQGDTGTTYGTAYDREGQRVFASAYAKRHTAYGPGGSGAIYVTDRVAGTTSLFATLPDPGGTLHDDDDLRRDPDFFAAPGRESLGDIELSEDGSTLWAVNMNDKKLYGLDAATGDITSDEPIPDPGCVGGAWHPMGLGVQDGKVYVGGICDAFDSQQRSDLMASVYESADGTTFSKVLDHTLDFLRGRVNDPGVVDVNTHWNPWYDEYDESKYYSAWVHAFPQPLLSDIDFDRDGSLLLGFRDRFGDQIGYDGLAPDGEHEGNGSAAAGDIIMVCLIDGSYVWEGEGACPSNVVPEYTGGAANGLTSEYFVGESVLGDHHQEPGIGSVAPIFRENDVVMTAIDTGNGAWQQGVQYLDLDDGTGMWRQDGRGSLDRGQRLSYGPLTFGKGNGLGDLSILADPAPIQIGNVVWFDEDKDGVQDPDEVPLPNVTVELLADDGATVLATTTTDENGEYYFSSLDTPLAPYGDYHVRFTPPADGETAYLGPDLGEVDWARLSFTDQDQLDNDAIDSDASVDTGTTGLITMGAPGADDHTIDAAFILEREPGYEHAKTSDPEGGTSVTGGDTITYTVTGSNTGELPLEVDIVDDMTGVLAAGAELTTGPDAVVYREDGSTVDGTPGADLSGQDLTWSGSVPAGGHVEVVYTVTVDDDVAPGTIFENRMSSVATPPPGDWPDTFEPDPVVIEHPVPGFEHAKTSDPASGTAVTGGDEITYTLTGENTGATSLDVVMNDDLTQVLNADGTEIGTVTDGPAAVVYDTDGTPAGGTAPAAAIDGTELSWAGELAIGQYVEIVYTVTLNQDVPGATVLRNGLTSTATPPDDDPITPDEEHVEHPTPEYAHSKTSNPVSGTVVSPGDEIEYTVTGYNSGATELNVSIADDLTDVLAHADLVGEAAYRVLASDGSEVTTGTADVTGTDLAWTGTLQPGERVEIVYTVEIAEETEPGAIVRNTMTSNAETDDGVELPEPPEVVTEHPIGGYTHSKTSDPEAGTAVRAGDEITYTVTGTNTGGARLEPVVITDDLGDVAPFAALPGGDVAATVYAGDGSVVSTSTADIADDVLTWTGALDVGEHVEIVYTVTVNEDVVGELVNHLSSEATPEGDEDPITPPDVEIAHPIPGYEHSKASDPASGTPVVAGDEITYTLTGENTGAAVLDPVAIRDDLSGVLVDGVQLLDGPEATVFDDAGAEVADAPEAAVDDGQLAWDGVLGIGERVEIVYTVVLTDDVEPGTVLVNALTSSATDPTGETIEPEEETEEHPVPGLDIVKFDAREGVDAPADPVDGPSSLGTTPGDWEANADADTAFDAARYEVGDDGSTGAQPVGMIVTNTGAVELTNVVVSDETLDGPDMTDVRCDFSPLGGPADGTEWAGPFEPGDSFRCTGMLELSAPQTHADRATVDADAVVELPDGETVTTPLSDTDDFHVQTPTDSGVDITKRDQASGEEADTTDDALFVPAGETRTIEMPVRNTGVVPLHRVEVGDVTDAGPNVTNLQCTFPDGETVSADADGIVRWEASFGDPGATWDPGVEFGCTAELTVNADDPWHADTVSVTAETLTGDPLTDEDPFVVGVPGIDIVKFDGRSDAPANPVDGPSSDGATPGDWSPAVDADTADDAVQYGLDGETTGAQPVTMIVTNIGAVPLTNVSVSDETISGPDVIGLTCDFSELGGPDTGTTWAGPFQPGDAFSCTGVVELAAGEDHADVASVEADAAVIDAEGNRTTITLSDSDEYHARAASLAVTGGLIVGVPLAVMLLLAGGAFVFVAARRRSSAV